MTDKPITMATPGVEPISRDGIEPGPGDLGIFRSIADLAKSGLVNFIEAGEVNPAGLSFKRWGGDADTANVTVSLGDGETYRLRMLVRVGKDPSFDLLVDNRKGRSVEWLVDLADALKREDETAIDMLERALVLARQTAQQEQIDQAAKLCRAFRGPGPDAMVCTLPKGHDGDHGDGAARWTRGLHE